MLSTPLAKSTRRNDYCTYIKKNCHQGHRLHHAISQRHDTSKTRCLTRAVVRNGSSKPRLPK